MEQQYPEWLTNFFYAVYESREAQKAYFQQPDAYRRKIAIGKESRVDELIKKAVTAGIIQLRENKQTTQPNLFNQSK